MLRGELALGHWRGGLEVLHRVRPGRARRSCAARTPAPRPHISPSPSSPPRLGLAGYHYAGTHIERWIRDDNQTDAGRGARARGRAVRRRAVRHDVPRRPGRGGDQDREPAPTAATCRARSGRISRAAATATASSSRASTATRRASRSTSRRPEGQAVFRRSGRAAPTRSSQPARRRAGEARRSPTTRLEGRQPEDRLRASLRLRPRGPARGLAGLRLPDAGGGRLFLPHRRARGAAGALRPLDRRPDDRPRAARPALLAALHAGARDGRGPRHRREPVRHGAPQPELPRPLVPQRAAS